MSNTVALRILLRDQEVDHLVFDKDRVTIGRDPESDVHLDNEGVSRQHASLLRHEGGYHFLDHGSSNGSLLNGAKAEKSALHNNDRLRVGKYDIVVGLREPESARVAPRAPLGDTIRVEDLSSEPGSRASAERHSSEISKLGFVGLATAIIAVVAAFLLTR